MNLPPPAASTDTKPKHFANQYRVFPGWTMVGVSAAAQFMSAPGQSYSVAAFKEPMRAGLDISETNYSLAYATATVISGVSLPLVGRAIDRFGARLALPLISLLLGFGCLGMSYVGSLTSLYVGFGVVRSLGQGALSLIAAWMVGEWFARRRGFATALSGLGGSLSVMTIPVVNGLVISQLGWEKAWVVLAFAVWVLLTLPSIILVRDRPEDLGLLPDGDDPCKKSDSQQDRSKVHDQVSWSVGEVMRDLTFWKLLSVPAAAGLVGTGLIFHQVSLLGSRGISPSWALGLISIQAVIASCAALVAGWLTDRCQSRYLLAGGMIMLSCASLVVLFMPFVAMAIVYAAMLGLNGSILRSTGMVVWMNYYGRNHQGAIRGVAMAVMILAAALGPLPLALVVDWFQSYDLALYGFVGLPIVAAVMVLTAGPPRHEQLSGS